MTGAEARAHVARHHVPRRATSPKNPPDLAVGPHWHSTWEMAANVCQSLLDGRDHDLRQNHGELTPLEQRTLEEVVLHSNQPDWQYHLTDLLKAGKGPRQIIDVLQNSYAIHRIVLSH